MNLVKKILITASALLLVSGCTLTSVPPKHNTAYDDIQQTLQTGVANNQRVYANQRKIPAAVDAALLPPVQIQLPKKVKVDHNRFDVSVTNRDAKEFFMSLVEGTKYNMVVSPDISGKISLTLKNATIPEVMDTLRDVYGFEYKITPSGFQVLPKKLVTQIFSINYLDVTRKGRSRIQVSSGQISDKLGNGNALLAPPSVLSLNPPPASTGSGSTIETTTTVDFWAELQKTLETLIGTEAGRSIIVNPQAGVIVVRAYPGEMRKVSEYLDDLQENLGRQVILEAKILEVRLNDGFESGIDWNLFGIAQNAAKGFTPLGLRGLGAAATKMVDASIFTVEASSGNNFNLLVKLLSTQGNVQVLSSPRISTMNNQTAIIKVGQDEFFVTGLSTTNTIISNNTLPSQDIELTPFFSGISLSVTPQIAKDKSIILHVHPTVSEVIDQNKTIIVSGEEQVLPLAFSTVRESDSIVRAKSGQVVVIGGLMENNTKEQLAATPGLGKLPVVGAVFRHTQQRSVKTELVILLRPTVVNE